MGALQVGIMRELIDHGFEPARIVGTSVGALNGAFLAFYPGMAGVEHLADIWQGLEDDHFIHSNPVKVAYRLASQQLGLFSNDFLRQLIANHPIEDDFSAAKVPLYITATNMNTGRKHVFNQGPVSQAVLASSAIPGVFPPVEIDDDIYLDGGIVANLDLETAVDLGAREILAIDLSHCFKLTDPKNVIGVITRTVDIVLREHVERDMEFLGNRANITLIQPEIEDGPGIGELRHVSRLIERGETIAEQVVDQCFDKRGRLRPGVISTATTVLA